MRKASIDIPPAPTPSLTPIPTLVTGEDSEEGGVRTKKSARATQQQLKAGTGTRIKKKKKKNDLSIVDRGTGGLGGTPGLTGVQIPTK